MLSPPRAAGFNLRAVSGPGSPPELTPVRRAGAVTQSAMASGLPLHPPARLQALMPNGSHAIAALQVEKLNWRAPGLAALVCRWLRPESRLAEPAHFTRANQQCDGCRRPECRPRATADCSSQ